MPEHSALPLLWQCCRHCFIHYHYLHNHHGCSWLSTKASPLSNQAITKCADAMAPSITILEIVLSHWLPHVQYINCCHSICWTGNGIHMKVKGAICMENWSLMLSPNLSKARCGMVADLSYNQFWLFWKVKTLSEELGIRITHQLFFTNSTF